MTKINFDDARLTAYALGELPVGDAALLEEALAENPALAEEVAAIRATAGLLHSEFAAEAASSQTTAQREQISMNGAAETGGTGVPPVLESAAGETPVPPPLNSPLIFRPRRAWAVLGLAAAACFVVAVIVTNSDEGPRFGQGVAREQAAQVAEEFGRSSGFGIAGRDDKSKDELKKESAEHPAPTVASITPDSMTLGLVVQDMSESRDRQTLRTSPDLIDGSSLSDKPDGQTYHMAQGGMVGGDAGASGSTAAEPTAGNPVALATTASPQLPPPPPPAPTPASSGNAHSDRVQLDETRRDTNGPSDLGSTGVPGRQLTVEDGGAMRPEGFAADNSNVGFYDNPDHDSEKESETVGKYREYLESRRTESKSQKPDGSPADSAGEGRGGGGGGSGRGPGMRVPAAGGRVRTVNHPTPPPPVLSESDINEMRLEELTETLRCVAITRNNYRFDDATAARLKAEHDMLLRRMKAVQAAGEQYNPITDNPFIKPVGVDALSTFSIDVDTASYANVRRFLFDQKSLPPNDAVRIEELINYFDFDYEAPSGDAPFSTHVEVNVAPWKPEHRLVKIGLRGKDIKLENRPAKNLVFLIDVSGSMNQPDKLPLVKESLKALVNALHGDDRLAIVTYAGNAGLAMNSLYVNAENKPAILSIIDSLSAGGGTNGAGGIQIAYNVAAEFFIKQGVNRVILCTDGDFNVGVSDQNELVRMIEEKRTSGVYLSVLGFGTGNLQDGKMEQLANHGNGAFAYIDTIDEGRRVLVEKMAGTLVTIAKDVKIQVEFNPGKVQAYRLIGYENRVMAAQDFNDDRKDAGEIGAGLTVTALYEVVPMGVVFNPPPTDALKYQTPDDQFLEAALPTQADPVMIVNLAKVFEMLTVKLRYKQPDAAEGAESVKIEVPVNDPGEVPFAQASADFQFAAAVAGFGMILRDSPHRGAANLPMLLDLAGAGMTEAHAKQRGEFMQLIEQARAIKGQ